MAVEYTWVFGPMKVEKINGLNDVVTGMSWICTAKDTAQNETVTGATSGTFSVPDANLSNYIPLTELTASDVEQWIEQFDKVTIEGIVLQILNEELEKLVYYVEVPAGINPEEPVQEEILPTE